MIGGAGKLSVDQTAAATLPARRGRGPAVLMLTFAAALIIVGIQSAIFYGEFTPRAAEANQVLLEVLTARSSGGAGRLPVADEDPYGPLVADLENPPWYLWPTAAVLVDRSGLYDELKFNASTYLAQVGEGGTARVLLTGLHATTEDPEMLGLVNFSLARLQFQLFRDRPSNEGFARSLQYLRQSLRADADSVLSRRFFDYLMSLEQSQAASREGQGDSNSPGEGEKAADTQEVLIF